MGEPINPEAWMWYRKVIGGDNCPIVDTWWQTETGGFMLTPLPGATPTKPGSATKPFPGILAPKPQNPQLFKSSVLYIFFTIKFKKTKK